MVVNEILKILENTQESEQLKIIEQSHQFLKKELQHFSFFDKKKLYQAATDRAADATKYTDHPELISGVFLFDLAKRKPAIYKSIRKQLNTNIELIVKSYNFLNEKLQNNPDKIKHSYQTALLAAGSHIGTSAICAALLHELPAFANINVEEIKKEFGGSISSLVANYQKIHGISKNQNQLHVAHLREMIVAMAEDLRVIIIKMCSNIDQLKNIEKLKEETKTKLAKESLEIMSPIADLLGMWSLRWKLEDHSFKHLYPADYEVINQKFNVDERKNREKYIEKTTNILKKASQTVNLPCQIKGRFKNFYSIYQKMQRKNKQFYEISDVFALRVIVNSIDECYQMLGIIHRLWRPKIGRVKDYLAAPKNNSYRSIHTTVYGLNGRPTEFQIRTRTMDDEANYGIAAHWYYKNPPQKTPDWIQEILLKQQKYQDDKEFLKNFTSDILQTRIYVYTPKGDIISLPDGATPIDFAYKIHTAIGSKCAEARVNEAPVQLHHELKTGDTVKIVLNRRQPGPKKEWLKFVKTNAAKKHINEYFEQWPVERAFRL